MSPHYLTVCKLASIAALTLIALLWPTPASANVPPLTDIAYVSTGGGGHTCALTTLGGVKCWGYGLKGQLGTGTTIDHTTSVNAIGLASGVVALDTGPFHTCAVLATGGVKCWGESGYGRLGAPADDLCNFAPCSKIPIAVLGLEDAVAVRAGGNHTCALTSSGGVKCWGANGSGQLGAETKETCGSATCSTTPVDVAGLSGAATAIAVGSHHACALLASGGVQCWGNNRYGQLGNGVMSGSNEAQPVPQDVLQEATGTELTDVTAVAAGGLNSCALTSTGEAKCWGWNVYGQLGDGTRTNRATAADVLGLKSEAVSIDTASHTCVVTSAGAIRCLGRNTGGELGNGTSVNEPPFASLTLVDVVGLSSRPTSVAVGGMTCAVMTDGAVKCWGQSMRGGLGTGFTFGTLVPLDVLEPEDESDTDQDGCTDTMEFSLDATAGGWRDSKNFWDVFDVWVGSPPTKDRRVSVGDLGAVVARFGASRAPVPTEAEALAEALTPPPDTTSYHAAFDRGLQISEQQPWNLPPLDDAAFDRGLLDHGQQQSWTLRPPDGNIVIGDIGAVVAQFGLDCA